MSKFRVGDHVRCVSSRFASNVGRTGVVVMVTVGGDFRVRADGAPWDAYPTPEKKRDFGAGRLELVATHQEDAA